MKHAPNPAPMPTTPLTPLQTQILGVLTGCKAASSMPYHVLAAINAMLYKRAGASDEDTTFHVGKMVDQSILRPDELPESIRKQLGY